MPPKVRKLRESEGLGFARPDFLCPKKRLHRSREKTIPRIGQIVAPARGGAVCRRNVTFDDSLGHTVGELPYRPAKFTEKELQAAVEMALVD